MGELSEWVEQSDTPLALLHAEHDTAYTHTPGTFIQGASTYALAFTAPADTTTLSDENGQPTATSTRTRLLEGYSIGCNLNTAAGDGSCEVSIDGPGTQRTYTGPLTPFYTLTSENGAISGVGISTTGLWSAVGGVALGVWVTL